MKAHCRRTTSAPYDKSISPRPISRSAPGVSSMVFESTIAVTLNAILAGKLALITPVIILTDGLCVAMIKCIPTARDNCASRAIGFSISLPAVMIKSANSSITNTIYGRNLCPLLGLSLRSVNFLLYSVM